MDFIFLEGNNVEYNIVQYVKKIALNKGIRIDKNTDLFECGIFDSLEIVKFLTYLEEIGINLTFEDLNFEHFQSIDSIISWLKSNIVN